MRIRTIIAASLLGFSGFAMAECTEVNVNTAEARTIADSLFRVGPVKSEAIVAYRETNGPFENAEEMDNVFGIGPGILALNEGCIITQ